MVNNSQNMCLFHIRITIWEIEQFTICFTPKTCQK